MKNRYRAFIGSSQEGKATAHAIKANLEDVCEGIAWDQGVFGLGEGTLSTLLAKAPEFDFAILVVEGEDMVESRGARQQSPRDNILLEAGIFMGVLGSKRTFLVYDRTKDIKFPSDLAGIQHASFQPPTDRAYLRSAVGTACTLIREAMEANGHNPGARRVDVPSSVPYLLHHVSVPVRSLEKSLPFYMETLRLQTAPRDKFPFPGEWLALPCGQQIHLVVNPDGTFRNSKAVDPRDVHFAIRVRDFGEAILWFHSQGIKPLIEPFLVGSLQLYLLDPDDHVIEVNAERRDRNI